MKTLRYALAVLVLALWAQPALAQVVLDVQGTQGTGAGTSNAYTGITVGAGSNRALVMITTWISDPGAITVVRWDNGATNQNLTLLQTVTAVSGQICKIYGLVNPIAGNKTLQLTWTNNVEQVMNSVAWTGVDQTGGATSFPGGSTATGSSTAPTITITLPTSGAVQSCIGSGTGGALNSVSATQVMLYSGTGAIEAGGSRSTSSGTLSGVLSASIQWGIAATGIAAAAGGGGTPGCKNGLLLLGVGCEDTP